MTHLIPDHGLYTTPHGWVEVVPLKDFDVASCVEAFMSSWRAPVLAVPETITSDRGTQLSSASWSPFCNKLGVQVMAASYHPQVNSLVDGVHKQLNACFHGLAFSPILATCGP